MKSCPYMTDRSPTRRVAERPVRWLLAAIGGAAVGLAALGVFVPGLPTTVFLIIGSYCLTRSCPALEKWVIGSRLFRPFVPYLDPHMPMPRRARITAISALLLCVGVSATIFWRHDQFVLMGLMIAAAAIGVTTILMWRRGVNPIVKSQTPGDQTSPVVVASVDR